MAAEPVSDQELSDAKAYLKSTEAMGLEKVSSQAAVSALDELLGLGYRDYQAYNEKIDAVTPERVREVVRHYLDVGHGAVVVTRSLLKDSGAKN